MFYGASAATMRTASILRKDTTMAERVLWKKLKDRNLFNVKFRRQHPIDMFIVDFYCHEKKLVIELDGEIHGLREHKKYDISRQSSLENMGLTVIRFTNHEVFFEMDSVLLTLARFITNSTPL